MVRQPHLISDAPTNGYQFPTFVLNPADRQLAEQGLGPNGRQVAWATVSFHSALLSCRTSTRQTLRFAIRLIPLRESLGARM
jgi:hypothetical protein